MAFFVFCRSNGLFLPRIAYDGAGAISAVGSSEIRISLAAGVEVWSFGALKELGLRVLIRVSREVSQVLLALIIVQRDALGFPHARRA